MNRDRTALVLKRAPKRHSLLPQLLSGIGFREATLVGSAAEAQEYLDMLLFDIAFVEVAADFHEGFEFIRAVRFDRLARQTRLPIVAVSSNSDLQLICSTRDAGVNGFLARPYSQAALKLQANRAINDRRDFIDARTYRGPDRRRWADPRYFGRDRRAAADALYLA